MVAGIFCSGTDFEISLLFENCMVAGSCCSSNGYEYKEVLKIVWSIRQKYAALSC